MEGPRGELPQGTIRVPLPRTRRREGACVLAGLLLLSGCNRPQDGPRYLVDDTGRQVVLHGVNVSNAAKSDRLGVAWHTEADYARLKEWGFNSIRLLLFWSVLEPDQGNYDAAYLDRIDERMDWAQRHGLSVVLDMHQDLYGPRFGGDGAPEWATIDDGHPFSPASPWWLNYLAPAVRASFSHLWRDRWLRDAYSDAWAEVAARFGDHPALIGYDLMNEPFMGDEFILTFELLRLSPFYKVAAERIRAQDPDAVIFFEPMAFPTASGLPSLMPPFGDPNAVYAPHYYDPIVHEGLPYHGNASVVEGIIAHKAWEAEQHGTPLVVGEFGAFSDGSGHLDYLRDLMSAFDRYAAGWMFWSYDRGGGFAILDENGQEKAVLDAIVRTYPQRVAGEIQSYSFDPASRVFELEFENGRGAQPPSEIFVPAQRLYNGSFQVESSDPGGGWSWSFDSSREVLEVWHDPSIQSHTITVRP